MTTESQATGGDNNQPGVQAGADGKPASGAGADDAKPDTTGADGKPVEGKPADGGDTKPKAGDESTDYKFTAPEGMELEAGQLAEFTTIAKELKLPQDQAQKLVDLAVKAEKGRLDAHAAAVKKWADDVKADKDIGGDKLAESSVIARKAIDLGPPELRTFLNDTGLGNHPLLFKWAHAIGKALSEDSKLPRGNAASGEKSAAEVLYGASSSKT